MYKLLLLSCFLVFTACNSSADDKQKEREPEDSAQQHNNISQDIPTKEAAQAIVKNWFDSFKGLVGGTSYEAENFDVLSVSGNSQRAYINFEWTGTIYPASIPNTDRTPVKVKSEKKTLLVSKAGDKWIVDEVR